MTVLWEEAPLRAGEILERRPEKKQWKRTYFAFLRARPLLLGKQ